MNYCLYKLRFTAPLHAGAGDSARSLGSACMTLRADTLFSALCHTALGAGGGECVGRLCRSAEEGEFRITDTMPYCGDALYIPKPYIKAAARTADTLSAEDRKAMKKLSHIPVSSLGEFFSSLRGAGRYDAKGHKASFGQSYITTKNTISRKAADNPEEDEENNAVMPYSVGLFEFSEGCGLYFIAAYKDDEEQKRLAKLVKRLGLGGIGGKVSSGYGKFKLANDPIFLDSPFDEDTEILSGMLYRENAPLYISLTTSLPRDEELGAALDGAAYGVCRRGGFVFSENFAETAVKKRTQYFLSAGSVFEHKYSGGLYEAAAGGNHPVFRYGRPIFLGADRP